MNTPSSAIALWDNGRLVLRHPEPPFQMTREQALEAVLWIACAVVFALFIAVLQNDVHRGEVRQAQQRARVLAELECESSRPAATRAGCLPLLQPSEPAAAVATAETTPPNTAYVGVTVGMAGVGGGAQ
jgi:hypothetical protein